MAIAPGERFLLRSLKGATPLERQLNAPLCERPSCHLETGRPEECIDSDD
jgi:hypothetical protein